MPVVRITPGERDAAFSIGDKRQWLRVNRGKSPDEYRDRGGTHLDRNRVGAAAEYAVAKFFGKDTLSDWCATKSYSEEHWKITCDVGSNVHVRATNNPRGRLIAHPYDPSGGVFVHVIAREYCTVFDLMGWALGSRVKSEYYWVNTGPGFGLRPAYVFPTELLYPIHMIPPEALLCRDSAAKTP